MKLTMFGTGYVGLVTGACFAEMGNQVLCVDIDEAKVDALRRGEIPIFEPGLSAMVERNRESGYLDFTTDIGAGVEHGDFLFIAVGTPMDEDGSADLAHVISVARSIGQHIDAPKIVVDKSTVPVGTGDRVRETIAEELATRGIDMSFSVVSNPEFLKEGAAVNDFMKPDRIVIGSDDAQAAHALEQLYAPFNRNHDKIVHMDVRSAELTKYAANVMLATRISLMNELANIAEKLDADIESVRRGIGSDPRIGYHFIYPGAGYGGSCFPKDVKALIHTADEAGHDALLVRSVESVNERQKHVLFEKVHAHFNGKLNGRTIAVWGLAFKPNTDDMREAPSLMLIDKLLEAGARVRAYDPAANGRAADIYTGKNDVAICSTRNAALEGADALVIVTEWNEFRSPDFDQLRSALNEPVIFDGRNLFDPDYLCDKGFRYYAIGRHQRCT